ncbi:MAG: CRISPR-associated endonuclease Cas1, partial [Verrucomicrobiales bacterium]|nr:CRISPR-associated endonuclease Cas1 [Verrucomicrobiales bacterium]
CSAPVLAAFLERDIPVVLLNDINQVSGIWQPAPKPHGNWRLLQYQKTLEEDFVLWQCGRTVAAKIYNQRRVLQRMAANRKLDLAQNLEWFQGILAAVARCTGLEELRGYEGAAAAHYFELWGHFLPPEFPFVRRSTRPPKNEVNACVSFGATLLYTETVALLHARGLDPALGLLHTTEDDRWSLALDMMEPFRPVLVEALVLDLFTHKMLNHRHFENRDGGVFLNQEGRAIFMLQYEKRMGRQFLSEHYKHRTTLRDALDHQITGFKSALEQPDNCNPFMMN